VSGIHLVRGVDEVLVGQAVDELLDELVGDGDRALVLEDVGGDEPDAGAIVAAAQTPPFLTDRRVVVGRRIDLLVVDQLGPLVRYLADPMPTTELVLVVGGGRLPKVLADALKSAGVRTIDASVPSRARDRVAWLDAHVEASGMRLDAAARTALGQQLGDDLGRLQSILETLQATYGAGARLGPDDVAPFVGAAGDVPPWDLTDAIDRGDTTGALVALRRMMQAGERHPLVVMAILHGHYGRMLRLDGAGASSRDAAAEVLGVKSPFQAGKALEQLHRLGPSGVRRAIELLAAADLDLRGVRELPEDVVMEVLVARLSRLGPRQPRSAAVSSRR
jgi:DNA polymerase-3 subunit delta